MTLLKDNDYKEINVALLSLEADIKNKITNIDTSVIDRQLAEINSRIDKINAGGNNPSAAINDIRTEIEDINSKLNVNSAKIEKIEQKLSDIFSADKKVTDFNATTGSGIYYWVEDAANKPGTDYGVLLVNKYDGVDSASNLWINQVAYGTNNKIYFRQNINSTGWTDWKAVAFDGEIIAKKVANALTVNGKTYDGSSAVNAGVQTVANGGTGATTALGAFESLANGLPEGAGPLDTEHIIFQNENRKNWGLYTLSQFWEYIKSKISSVLGLTKDSYGGKSAKSSFLDEYVGAGGTRPTSGNIIPKDATEYGGMRKDVVTSSMTDSGRPALDGHLLTMFWDNSGRYDNQFFVSNEKQPLTVKVRAKANEADYGPWVDIITSQNIGSQTVASAGNADKALDVIDYGNTSRTVRIGYEGPGVTADKLLYLAGYTEQNGSSIKIKDVNKEELIKWLGIPRIKYADYTTPTQTFPQFGQVPIELSKFSSEVTPDNVLCFMVIYWQGVQLIASADWGNSASSGLKCALIALQAGTGCATIRCVYMV